MIILLCDEIHGNVALLVENRAFNQMVACSSLATPWLETCSYIYMYVCMYVCIKTKENNKWIFVSVQKEANIDPWEVSPQVPFMCISFLRANLFMLWSTFYWSVNKAYKNELNLLDVLFYYDTQVILHNLYDWEWRM